MKSDRWEEIDAAHDAHQARLMAEARGQRIAHPAAYERTATWRRRQQIVAVVRRELEAWMRFEEGGHADLYGEPRKNRVAEHREILRGEEYKAKLREQSRERAARARAKGVKRSGRDG